MHSFVATVTDDVMAQLRCDPDITEIGYDISTSTG
jgi:hypothetical protein